MTEDQKRTLELSSALEKLYDAMYYMNEEEIERVVVRYSTVSDKFLVMVSFK